MITLEVKTIPTYHVQVGHNLCQEVLPKLAEDLGTELVIVTDSNLAKLHLPQVQKVLQQTQRKLTTAIFPAGEASKTLDTCVQLLETFAQANLTRSGAVIALGGGVTGDLAAFAASIWLRGVPVIQLPTSLLAMVDSSVGGKTGVDTPFGKNLVGSFHQPAHVIADTAMLGTLPRPQQLDGMAEMIKSAIIANPSLLEQLTEHPMSGLTEDAIAKTISIKAAIVAQDPQEQGPRKLLNLGHTAAHAIEKVTGFQVSHGHAVAMGTCLVAKAGLKLQWTSPECYAKIIAAFQKTGLPTLAPVPMESLLDVMLQDKKRTGNYITLVVPQEPGDCRLHKIPVEDLPEFWQHAEE